MLTYIFSVSDAIALIQSAGVAKGCETQFAIWLWYRFTVMDESILESEYVKFRNSLVDTSVY